MPKNNAFNGQPDLDLRQTDLIALSGGAADSHSVRELAALQLRSHNRLIALIEQVAQELADAEPLPTSRVGVQPDNILALRQQSLQRQKRASLYREEAEHLVIASLHNLDNPGWDPAEPETYASQGHSIFQQLLQWQGA